MPPAKVKIQRIEVRACARGRGAGGGRGAGDCGGQLPAHVPHLPLWLLRHAAASFWRAPTAAPPYGEACRAVHTAHTVGTRDEPYQTLPKPKTINLRARAHVQGDRVRQNTFHKRKMGLIKKAMELTVRCTRNAAPLAVACVSVRERAAATCFILLNPNPLRHSLAHRCVSWQCDQMLCDCDCTVT